MHCGPRPCPPRRRAPERWVAPSRKAAIVRALTRRLGSVVILATVLVVAGCGTASNGSAGTGSSTSSSTPTGGQTSTSQSTGSSTATGPASSSIPGFDGWRSINPTAVDRKRTADSGNDWTAAGRVERKDLGGSVQVGASLSADATPDLTAFFDNLTLEPMDPGEAS